jgi:hypothetical protein
LHERLRFRDGNDQAGRPILERNGLTRAAAFWVINKSPFSVWLTETLVNLGLSSFTFSTTNKNNE